MLKSDAWIYKAIEAGVIRNAQKQLVTKGVLSFGVSSYGYDVQLGSEFKLFRNDSKAIIDPKSFNDEAICMNVVANNGFVVVPPHSFILGKSVETFSLPKNVTGLVFPKSTYARCGLDCCQTVLEAGWSGEITLEFANTTNCPIKLYTGEGCCQVLFIESDEKCLVSYADRKGKYQGQTGVTLPFVKG